MGTAFNSPQLSARYHHVPVMSDCEATCRLCATLGCLRPTKITSHEFQRELDWAQRNLKTAIVFPPNLLHHPEAAQFVTDAASRNLRAVVRLRPEHLVVFSELIATLGYRHADFEVVIAEPLSSKVLNLRRSPLGPTFKTVFVPTSRFDPSLLLESLPREWRNSVEILAPLQSSQPDALSPDELYLFTSSLAADRRVRPYVELDRRPHGLIPGAAALETSLRFRFRALGGNDESLRLTLCFAVTRADTSALERQFIALKNQTYARQKFEVVLVFDRASDETVDRLRELAAGSGLTVQGLELSSCWGQPAPRTSQALNLAASFARGSHLVFMDASVPSIELLNSAGRELETKNIFALRSDAGGTSLLAISLQHFFEVGAFAEALQGGRLKSKAKATAAAAAVSADADAALSFLIWKSRYFGPAAAVSESPPLLKRKQAQSAQEFYLCTLSAEFFRSNFALMGSHFQARRVFKFMTHLRAVRVLCSAKDFFGLLLQRERKRLTTKAAT